MHSPEARSDNESDGVTFLEHWRLHVSEGNHVEGYVYTDLDNDRANQIAQIVGRVPVRPGLGFQPAFLVEFGDGTRLATLGVYLRPWYSV